MNRKDRTILGLLLGVGIGIGLTLLFAPQSGEETRDWIADASRRARTRFRNQSRRSLGHIRDLIARGRQVAEPSLQGSNGSELG